MDSQAEAEFSEFMLGRWPRLVRLGYGLTGDQGLAEDLAQTALAKAFASWPRVRRAGDPDAYVRRIMLNANSARFRKRRVREQLTGEPDRLGQQAGGTAAGGRGARARLCLAGAMTTPSLRDRLRGGEPVYGGWSIIPAVHSARALAAAGLDYVVIDLQHGGATEHDLPGLTMAIKQAGATPFARVGTPTRRTSGACSTWGARGSSSRTSTPLSRPPRSPGPAGTRRSATGRRAGPWPRPSRSAS